MKSLVSAITLSLSALVATSAMAAPQDHSHATHTSHSSQTHQQTVKHNTHTQHAQSQQQSWKTGNAFPSQYHSAGYKIDYKQHKNLNKPTKHQQWYKVNGQYILMNTTNHKIVKVVR